MSINYLHNTTGGGKMRRSDDASEFKRQSMNAIRRRKMLKRVTFITLLTIALLMGAAVVLAYTIG